MCAEAEPQYWRGAGGRLGVRRRYLSELHFHPEKRLLLSVFLRCRVLGQLAPIAALDSYCPLPPQPILPLVPS